MKSKFITVLKVAIVVLSTTIASAQSVENLSSGFPIKHNSANKIMGQTFKTGPSSEKLESIEFKIVNGSGNGGMVSMALYEIHKNTLKQISSTSLMGYNHINVCRFNDKPLLKANTTYAFVMKNGGSNFYSVFGSNKNAYKHGRAIQVTDIASNAPKFTSDSDLDLYFKVKFDVPNNAKILGAGESAMIDKKVYSPNKKFYAVFQKDGNFVVYNANNHFQWGTYNNLKAPLHGSQLIMQTDGNLVINKSNGQYVWSKYHNYNQITPSSSLFINDLGEIIIITPTGKVMYVSK